MAKYCIPYSASPRMSSTHPNIKMEHDPGEDEPTSSSPFNHPAIPIATVMTANENWRGKNDPAERRRIQNRLNQRAFRQRQRAGESPKQYKARSGSRSSATRQEDSDDEAESVRSEGSATPASYVEGRRSAPPAASRPNGVTDTQTGQVWDELAQLINRNFMSAAVTNAQHLGVDVAALQAGTPTRTPRASERQVVPSTLTPVELQYQLAHDPIIDIIPHARLRFNILRGMATGQLDATSFSRSIRSSGALEESNGSWQRGGVVIWSSAEQLGSWELSEPFVRRWSFLLQGCEDLVAATNAWRGKRGERLFPLTFGRSA